MRVIKYLSPTSVGDFGESGDVVKRTEFYLKRLAENRPPRLPQTHQMAVGSSFDAYVKNYLHEKLYGNAGKDVIHKYIDQDGKVIEKEAPEFEFDTLFLVQVEPHNRKQAHLDGKRCLDMYRSCGAMSDLLLELQMAQGEVNFEITVEANVSHKCMICEVPVLGKPDLKFNTRTDTPVIFDWKVNGFYAKSMKSPAKGYIKCRDSWDYTVCPPSRGTTAGVAVHKDVILQEIGGIWINAATKFEQVNRSFARQLTMYGWVLGVPVGAPFIIGIEQLCGKPWPGGVLLRCASHRGMVSEKFQYELALELSQIWNILQSGHIFDWMSRDESDAKCSILDEYHEVYEIDPEWDDEKRAREEWFRDTTRPVVNY